MQVEIPAIEVPGEANPLTEGILFQVLRAASSTDPTQIQSGTKQLQAWQTAKSFYPLLQRVFVDRNLPLEVRYLAIIQLKNGIDKYWRKTASNAVDKEDKDAIRMNLLEAGINEADQRLAVQNAVVIAKIVRMEFPNDWPDVIPQLLQMLKASAEPTAPYYHLPRALLILLYIVKELSTGRLIKTKRALQTVTPETLNVLGSIFVSKVQSWQTAIQNGGPPNSALQDLQNSLLAIKAIRRLVIAGYEFPGREEDVRQFWTLTQNVFNECGQQILGRDDFPLGAEARRLVEKHMMQLAKFHLNMATTHPTDFVLLPGSLDLVHNVYWKIIVQLGTTWKAPSVDGAKIGTDGEAEDEVPILERLGLKGLLLIRACTSMVFYPAKTFKYRHPQEKEEKAEATSKIKSELLRDQLVQEMLFTMIKEFFVFRPSDLRMWEEEPDEWEKMEEGLDDWEFAIRPCAEKLFLDLAKNYKDLILQPLLGVFQQAAAPENEDVLFKDAIYTAIGLAADILADHLDIDAFVTNTLVAEVQKQKPGFNIVRRRIAILLAQWITVKMSDSTKPIVYQIYQYLMDKSDPLNDQIVRVTAGRQFHMIADEWEFKAQNFLPYAPAILDGLMGLVQEVEHTETKMALLNTISNIVVRMEHHITPYANSIISLLPPLWDASGDEHLMKQAILTLLTRLTDAMKAESRQFHTSFLPIIQSAIEPGSEVQVYLLEDAMDLWASILAQSPSDEQPPEALLNLIQYLIPLYSMDNETLRKSLEITESYILLSPTTILSDSFRPQLLAAFSSLHGSLKPEANGLLTEVMQCIIRGADGLGGEAAIKIVTNDLISSGFLQKTLEGLHGAWEHHQSHGPNRELPSRAVDGVVETDYFNLLARIGVASPAVLLETLTSVSGGSSWEWLLDEWFGHIDNIGMPFDKKLMALVLTRLLETGGAFILGRLQDLMAMWTAVLGELLDGMDDNRVDCLYWAEDPELPSSTDPEAPEVIRKRILFHTDPVHRVNLVAFVREHLQQAIQGAGGEAVFEDEWLSRVDKDVVKGFMDLGIMNG